MRACACLLLLILIVMCRIAIRTGPNASETVPSKHEIKPHWQSRSSLTIHNDILLLNDRIVVPRALQNDTIDKIYVGHQGIERCRKRANSCIWWPRLSAHIGQKLHSCTICNRD